VAGGFNFGIKSRNQQRRILKMSDKVVESKKEEMPDTIMLAKEDVLSVHILYEREMRLNAEINNLRNEQIIVKMKMAHKYGIDFENYSIDTTSNTARRNK